MFLNTLKHTHTHSLTHSLTQSFIHSTFFFFFFRVYLAVDKLVGVLPPLPLQPAELQSKQHQVSDAARSCTTRVQKRNILKVCNSLEHSRGAAFQTQSTVCRRVEAELSHSCHLPCSLPYCTYPDVFRIVTSTWYRCIGSRDIPHSVSSECVCVYVCV